MELIDKIMALLSSVEASAAVIAVVVEFVLRLVKTEKPKSLLYAAAAIVRGLGVVLTKLAEVMDKILPQKLAEPKAE